jgi:hypothetical protein
MNRVRPTRLLAGAYVISVVVLALAAAISGRDALFLAAWISVMPWGLVLPGVVFILGVLQWAPLVEALSLVLYVLAAIANVVTVRAIWGGVLRRYRTCSWRAVC